MKHRILLLLALLGLFFTSCWEAPQPPVARDVKILATVQAILDASGAASAQLMPNARSSRSALPDTAISFTRKFSSVFEDETSKQRYLNATFEVQNASGQDFKNLTLYAYTQAASSIGGTAIKKMVNFGLDPISSPNIAQNIKPTHGMKHVGADVLVNPDETDFQAYQWNEVNQVRDAARTLGTILNDDEVLEYGFVARSALGGRAIGNNGKGYVTIALRLPKQSDKSLDPYKFVMTFVLADDAVTRVTRSAEESTSEVEARATQLNASEVVLIGPDLDTVAGKTTIRVPNVKISTAPASLLESKLFLTSVAPLEISNDQTTPITVTGQEFSADTSFFVESTKLEVTSINPNRATLNIPAGFEPANYGLMAVNPDGSRATLYPGFSIKAGTSARAIDPQLRARSFVDGYVIDYQTQQPLSDAKISLWNGTGTLEAITDTNGYFLIRGVPAGQNVFKIDHTGYASVYRNANVLGDAQTVTLALAALEPNNPNTQSIDATGGTYYANGLNPSDGFLVVPPGALNKAADIQFTQLHAPETMPELPQNNLFTAFAKLEPSGLVFKKPATLFLPIANDLNRTAGQKVPVLYFDTQQGKWVNEITSGVISSMNGKLFVEYEITHFSYAGAGSDDGHNVRGCVLFENGDPAFGITTNWEKTDPDGEFRDSVRSLKPGSTQIAKVHGFAGIPTVSAVVAENGSLDFPCIKLPTPSLDNLPKPEIDVLDNCSPPVPSPVNTPNPIQTRSVQTRSVQTRAVPVSKLLLSESAAGTSVVLPKFRELNIDPSKIKFTIGNVDFTDKAVITVEGENLSARLRFSDPIKAQIGLEFKLSVETKEGKKAESSSFADVVAKFKVPNVAFAVIPDNAYPESVITPAILEHQSGMSYIYRERDVTNNRVKLEIPVKALDEAGKLLPLTRLTYVKFSGVDSNFAVFEGGIAKVPLQMSVSEANQLKLSLGQLVVDGNQAQTQSQTSLNSRSSRVKCVEGMNVQTPDGKEPVAIAAPKSAGQLIGEFFSWTAVQALGLVPILSGAIDCSKGAYALIANTEVDLLETEIGCVSMSLDALMTAAAIADACVTCPAYLANKSIMIFLKTVNRVSKAAGGYLTKGLLALFEKFRSGAISAAEFITKISEYSGLKKLLENGGEAALRDAESVMGRLLGLGCSVVKTRDSRSSPADCDPAVLASLVTNASNALQQAGLDPAEFWKNMRRICGDAGSSEECLQGAENLLNKLKTQGNSPQNMKGLFYEAKWAAAVKNFGTKPIRITTGEEFTAVNALTGAVEKSEAELLGIRLSDGATVWDDVKSTLQWTDSNIGIGGSYVKDLEQAAKFARVAKANGFVPRYAVYNIPFVSCVAVRELINLGIEVVDGNTGLNITLSNFNPQC